MPTSVLSSAGRSRERALPTPSRPVSPARLLMTTESLATRLAPQLTRLLEGIERRLAVQGHPSTTRLFGRVEVLDPARPEEVLGGVVREDGAAQVAGAWTLDCTDAFRTFVSEALRADVPVSRVELTCAPAGAGRAWTVGLEQVTTELRVRPERIRLDGQVYRAMMTAAGTLWDGPSEKTLTFGVRPGTDPQLILLTATDRRRLDPPAELLDLLAKVEALYRAHGRTLSWPEWEVEGVPGDYQLQSSLPYRVVGVPTRP